jgi:hypothetical protein
MLWLARLRGLRIGCAFWRTRRAPTNHESGPTGQNRGSGGGMADALSSVMMTYAVLLAIGAVCTTGRRREPDNSDVAFDDLGWSRKLASKTARKPISCQASSSRVRPHHVG